MVFRHAKADRTDSKWVRQRLTFLKEWHAMADASDVLRSSSKKKNEKSG